MKFSILIPTRERPYMLIDFMNSVYDACSNPHEVEFLIKIDDDDICADYHSIIPDKYYGEISYRIFVETRSPYLANDYYNYLAERAKGDFIWPVNDDCILLTPPKFGWDEIILDAVEKRGLNGKVVYVNTGVSGHTDLFAPFPMVSRQVIKALGYLHHKAITTWDSDVILWNIFNGLKNIHGIDRMIDLRDKITIIHHNSAGDIGDKTQSGMRDNYPKGLTAGGFKDGGYYNEPIELLRKAVDNE